jgi:hypothetical protein
MHALLRGAQSAQDDTSLAMHPTGSPFATSGIIQDPPSEAAPRTAEMVAELGVALSELM